MMNFNIQYPYISSPQEAASYFNSIYSTSDYQCIEYPIHFYQPMPYQCHFYFQPHQFSKADVQVERSTADSEEVQAQNQEDIKVEVKQQSGEQIRPEIFPENQNQLFQIPSIKKSKQKKTKATKQKNTKNLKKNTEVNLINNIISYVSSEMKSHKAVKRLLMTIERKKIFYIFMKNLKKLNQKYLNRKNVQAILQLTPNQPQEQSLSKSVKRIQILPIPELRVILRRLIYDYLSNDASLLPVLTSKKICRKALKEHMEKRRELLHYFFKEKKIHD